LVVALERRDDVSDLRNEFRTHEVERGVVEYDSSVCGCDSIEPDLCGHRSCGHGGPAPGVGDDGVSGMLAQGASGRAWATPRSGPLVV
jgi:hypothetical protein